MKIVHIESGLGNQMLSYCEYLALKKMNPKDEFCLETMIYDIPECNDVICQWNGYELERIFGIKQPENLRVKFTEAEWNKLMEDVRASEFWKHNWNYPVAITNALNNQGMNIENIRGDFEAPGALLKTSDGKEKTLARRIKDSRLAHWAKRMLQHAREESHLSQYNKKQLLFLQTGKNIFTGQWLALKFRGNGRELIDEEIRRTFIFPPLVDERSKMMARVLEECNSVAIHARRGDLLGLNGWCYKYGYFKRAVKLIRKNVKNPVFVFFTNTGSIEWCKENMDIFGLNSDKDKILFVDWNVGEESYRDMQLMGYCKHAIITQSSFGWWGAYFITNPDKITISPTLEIDTTHHC